MEILFMVYLIVGVMMTPNISEPVRIYVLGRESRLYGLAIEASIILLFIFGWLPFMVESRFNKTKEENTNGR